VVEAVSGPADEESVAAGQTRAQLDRILKSTDFEATARERKFLSYVVNEELEGRGSRIKAYSIAVEVFGRDASFDPQNDPIVRIEAGHLRRSLERYYLTAGPFDPIRIEIPKGGYVPVFRRGDAWQKAAFDASARDAMQAAAAPGNRRALLLPGFLGMAFVTAAFALGPWFSSAPRPPSAPEVPRLLVEAFDDLSGEGKSRAIAAGLRQEVISELSKFRDVGIVEAADPSRAPRYALAGAVDLSEEAFRLQVKFVKRADGTVLWADSYDGRTSVSDILQAQADIARNIATSLADSYGVIYQSDLVQAADDPPDDWAAYSCTLAYYAYRIDLDAQARAQVRSCLQRAVADYPDYSTAWALLSQVALDDVRFQFPFDPVESEAAIDAALAMARRAVRLDPRNLRALHAEVSALFFNKEFEAGHRVGEQALAINPNDSEILGGFGTHLALSGSWDEGCSLIERARERNAGPFGYYEAVLSLCSYVSGDHGQSAMWIRKASMSRNPLYHLIAAAIYGGGGMAPEAAIERSWLEANAPALVGNVRTEVERRLARAEDVALFLDGLGKAGLSIPPDDFLGKSAP